MWITGTASMILKEQGWDFNMKQILNSINTFFEMWTNATYAAHLARNHDWAGAKAVMTKQYE